MMFNKKFSFEVITIMDDGIICKDFYRGKKKDVMRDIKKVMEYASKYEMVGKNGMIVWA